MKMQKPKKRPAKKPPAPTPPAPPADAELLDVLEVARLLTCSSRHVTRMAETGEFPSPIALGRLRRWRRADVLAWLSDPPSKSA